MKVLESVVDWDACCQCSSWYVMRRATGTGQFLRDEGADPNMVGILLLVAIVIILAGTLYVVMSKFANANVQSESYAAIIPFKSGDGELQFTLVKSGVAGYDLAGTSTGHSVKVTVNGHECDPAAGEVRVDGHDNVWEIGERLILDNGDCNGGMLSTSQFYTVIIALNEQIGYRGDLRPTAY